ncbi:TPA: coat protein [Enterobacter bugandensis]|nr:coat protein [Enterobacter bugandensis]
MANQLVKDLEIMFENYVNGFEAACIMSRAAKTFRPGDQTMQRAGDVIYRPQHYHMKVVEGLALQQSDATDLLQRMVPAVYRQPQNIVYQLDAKEMRDDEHKTEAGRAAGQRLAAQIDLDLANEVAKRATNVVTVGDNSTGTLGKDLWGAAAKLKGIMTQLGVPAGIPRRGFWSADDALSVASELAGRQYTAGINQSAWEAAKIGRIAGFDSYETDVSGTVPDGTSTAITLAAAPAHKIEIQAANGTPADNREGTITVSAAGLQVGDAFTIAGVNMVHQINKANTAKPQVFRVLAVSGTTVTISPKILPVNNADVPSQPYANVDKNPAANAALTILNKNPASVSSFWADGSVELMLGKLAFPTNQGAQVMTATTKQGATLIMAYQFDIMSAKTTARFTTLYGTNVLVPEYTGIIIPGQ